LIRELSIYNYIPFGLRRYAEGLIEEYKNITKRSKMKFKILGTGYINVRYNPNRRDGINGELF